MSEMNSVKWHFREMARTEMNQDIELGEFFSDERINDRLVREVIQNSLDASIAKKLSGKRTIEEPVRVRISLDGLANPLPIDRAAVYFAGLSEHLSDIEVLDYDVRRRAQEGTLHDSDVPFVVIEDSGTTGLLGAPEQSEDPPQGSTGSNDFYWFFRNVGRSGKGATDNGSWGLGKWVFPDASGARAFFALTTTSEDTLLMGHTVLKEHNADGLKFAPYGYWSDPDDEGFAMPLRLSNPEHRPVIEQFISDFGLSMRDEPGLSVVIPFPRVAAPNESSAYGTDTRELVKAAVHNYFYPIVLGWLEVSIVGAPGEFPVDITAGGIRDVVNGLDTAGAGQWTAESYRRIFQMLEETTSFGDDDFIVLTSPPAADDDYVHADELKELRGRYENGELLAFRVRTQVRPKNEDEIPSEFVVYLRQHADLEVGHDYFIRGTLSIPRMDFIKNYKALALIVVDENERLAEMLQDSEPPAHTMWRPQTQRVRDRWVSPQRRINAVRDSVKNILFFLEGQPSGLQKDAFLDLFALTGAEMAAETGGESGRGTKTGDSNGKIKPGPPSPFTVFATKGGISIHASKQAKELPNQIIVRAAYDIPRGNPFVKFNENDFAFRGKDGLRVKLEGGEILKYDPTTPIGANAVRLKVKDRENFSFKITGFDEFRDVVVKIDQDEST